MSINKESAETKRQNFEASALALAILSPEENARGQVEKAIRKYNASDGWRRFWEDGERWESRYPWKAPTMLTYVVRLQQRVEAARLTLNVLELKYQLAYHEAFRRLAVPTLRERFKDEWVLLISRIPAKIRPN